MADSCIKYKLRKLDEKRGQEPVFQRARFSFFTSIQHPAEESKWHKPDDISHYIIIRCKYRPLHKEFDTIHKWNPHNI